jgi:hypothetical protein
MGLTLRSWRTQDMGAASTGEIQANYSRCSLEAGAVDTLVSLKEEAVVAGVTHSVFEVN